VKVVAVSDDFRWEVFEPFPVPRPNVYQVMADAQNNLYISTCLMKALRSDFSPLLRV